MKTKALFLIPALIITSCSSQLASSPASGSLPAESDGASLNRKLTKKASMTMKSRSLKSSADKSIALVKTYHAHLHSSSMSENRYEATIKVHPTDLEPLLTRLESAGKVTHKHISSDDVTAQHRDLSAELKNKTALRARLHSLLAKATEVSDILKIEKELARLQTEIDQLSQRLNSLNSKVNLSTLTLTINRDRIPGPLGLVTKSGGWVFDKLNYLN
ncbi:DUF4349 domain-containing protein [Akkermansiaceae bacterium]|nr:DUF4349 domain-containing protein [Akkermansiaceae bacterium]